MTENLPTQADMAATWGATCDPDSAALTVNLTTKIIQIKDAPVCVADASFFFW